MNTFHKIQFPPNSALCRFLLPAVVIAVFPAAAGAQETAKTHTLFMGADISVGQEKELYPVQDVSGSSWVIDVDGQTKVVSTKSGPLNIKVTPVLKLTEASAELAGLSGTPAYTSGNDPSTRLTKALDSSAELNAGYQAAVTQSQFALLNAQVAAGAITGTNNHDAAGIKAAGGIASTTDSSQGAGNVNAQTARLATSMQQTSVSAGSDLEMTGDRGNSLGFDAMEVTFGVSAPRRLNNPYVVIITRFSEKGGAKGAVKKMIYAKALGPIDVHPTSVDILEGGFPPAFELKDFEVHLYNQGEEIATNVSAKRVELTRDEAFEYVKIEYLGSHKGDTLPATPVMGRLPADLPARLAEGRYAGTYYVRVSKDGMADGVFSDAACTKSIGDPYLESVARSIRFKPALESGKPVAGTATLNLGKLKI